MQGSWFKVRNGGISGCWQEGLPLQVTLSQEPLKLLAIDVFDLGQQLASHGVTVADLLKQAESDDSEVGTPKP